VAAQYGVPLAQQQLLCHIPGTLLHIRAVLGMGGRGGAARGRQGGEGGEGHVECEGEGQLKVSVCEAAASRATAAAPLPHPRHPSAHQGCVWWRGRVEGRGGG
jgi:hypothetical protein